MARQRVFTIPEVNEMIPRLELIMEQMQRHGRTLRAAVAEVATAAGWPVEAVSTSDLLEQRPELRTEAAEIERLLGEIEACGGQFKGLDLGLVDFPGEMEGEVVFLCWQYGEKEITHYHTMEEGFAGRRPIDPGRGDPRCLQ